MRLLIVEDDDNGLVLLKRYLRHQGYDVDTAINGELALEQAKQQLPDLIISDIMMPKMDGFELCRRIKQDPQLRSIPFIFNTATYIDSEAEVLAMSLGAVHFVIKPVPFDQLLELIKNTLKEHQSGQLAQPNVNLDVLDTTERHEALLTNKLTKKVKQLEQERRKLQTTNSDLQNALERLDLAHNRIKLRYIETIQRLTLTSEYKDPETGGHIKRTSFYCQFIAKELGLDSSFVETIYFAAPMHDIGKVGIPDTILLKKGALDKDEWKILTTHTKIGAGILSNSDSSYLRMGHDIAYCHHEKWDGTGYPRMLKGEDIPISGRIMMLADIYDALRSKRPYKEALSHEQAKNILLEGDGNTSPKHFDPKILDIFKKHHSVFNDISASIMD